MAEENEIDDAPEEQPESKPQEPKETLAMNEGIIADMLKPAEPEKKPEAKVEEKPVEAAPEKHSPDTISRALSLQIPPEEIDDMTPKELARLVSRLEQAVTAARAERKEEPAPKPEPNPQDEIEAELKKMEEDGYDEIQIRNRRDTLEIRKENKELREMLSRQQQPAAPNPADVQKRILGVVETIAPGAFDMTTAKGQAQYREMCGMAHAIAINRIETGRGFDISKDEPEVLAQAMRAVGIEIPKPAEKAKKEAELDERRKKWKGGALGEGVDRAVDEDPVEKVLRRIRREQREAEKREREAVGLPT